MVQQKIEVTTSPDGEIISTSETTSLMTWFMRTEPGTIRGTKLIQQIDEENHVEPVQVILSENQIKAMSIRGVTLHLPQNGIERLFIYSYLKNMCFVIWMPGSVQCFYIPTCNIVMSPSEIQRKG